MELKSIIIILAIIIIMIFLIIILFNLGNFLIVDEDPLKSDVIVALSGDNLPRTNHSVMLFKKGYSDKLLFTGDTVSNDKLSMEKQAIILGLSQNDIVDEDKAGSTYENAIFSKESLIKYGYKSAIIVTSDYHMRRSRLVFNKVFKDTDITLTFCSAKSIEFNVRRWWTKTHSAKIVLMEYAKLMVYFFEGRLF